MIREYPRVVESFFGSPWLITADKLAEIQAVLLRRIDRGPVAFEDADFTAPRQAKPLYELHGAAALISVHGVISPRPSVFASGGASADVFGRAIDAAAADQKVEKIVIDFDSPGGSIQGVPESAAKILAARKVKPVIAVGAHTIASGAYWWASQASEIVLSPSGWAGSIGVIWPRIDESAADEKAGVKTHLVMSTGSPHKQEDHPSRPATEPELAERQRVVDALYDQFAAGIAKGRGIKASVVQRDFGGGRMLLAEEALAARMVDRIATLEDVIGQVNGVKSTRTKRRVAASLASHGLPVGASR